MITRKGAGLKTSNYIGHNYIVAWSIQSTAGHNYIGHNFTGHNYIGHNYIGHNYIAAWSIQSSAGHNYIGHNYIGLDKGGPYSGLMSPCHVAGPRWSQVLIAFMVLPRGRQGSK